MKSNNPWQWKIADPDATQGMGLLYEPGNWGDLFKGLWLKPLVDLFPSDTPNTYIDPFAGRPHYPLIKPSAERLLKTFSNTPPKSISKHLAAGKLPSTASWFLEECCLQKLSWKAKVFDLSEEARQQWLGESKVELLPLEDGYQSLKLEEIETADFLLFDPYDFFDTWRDPLPRLFELSHSTLILIYMFNKAPRGAGYFQNYRALKRTLENELQSNPLSEMFWGRCPQDSTLPRAYHDLILLGPKDLVRRVSPELKEITHSFSQMIAREGWVE